MKLALLCLVFFQTVVHVLCIIFGKNSPDDEDTRFMVSLQAESPDSSHFCSGVFIRFDFVLTAASCVKNKQPQDFWIAAGIKQLSDKGQLELKCDQIFSKDPSGQNNVRNNIALLHIATEIPDSDREKVRTIDLAPDGADEAEGKICQTYGWGAPRTGVNDASDMLQVATKEMTNWKNCRQQYKNNVDTAGMPNETIRPCSILSYNNDVDESNICTSCVDTAQLCYFDAGDPLISENYLLGLATENYLCVTSNNNDVYTRVHSHKDWIRKIIQPGDSSPTGNASPESSSSLTQYKSHVITMVTGVIMLLTIWRGL